MHSADTELAAAGHVNESSTPFNAKSFLAMIEGPMPEKRDN
jgi:hypothetical protein